MVEFGRVGRRRQHAREHSQTNGFDAKGKRDVDMLARGIVESSGRCVVAPRRPSPGS
jgi:hypothetical protein